MEVSDILGIAFAVVIALAIVVPRSIVARNQQRMIRGHLADQGYTMLTCRSLTLSLNRTLFWVHRITYCDETGRIHSGKAQTGPHGRVFIRHEKVLTPGSGPPPLPMAERIRLLEAENAELRAEIRRELAKLSISSPKHTPS